MCKKTKYKNYRIGKYLFTVEIKKGCDCFGDYFLHHHKRQARRAAELFLRELN